MSIRRQIASPVLLFMTAGVLGQTVPNKPSAAIPFPAVPLTLRLDAASPPGTVPARIKAAQVHFADGRLQILADDSSLNQILRDVTNQMGVRITGGVPDERVFGTYGPAEAGRVLTALLNGTDANMLLLEGKGGSGGELILTPRTGVATPPGSGAAFDRNDGDEPFNAPAQRQRRFGSLPGSGGDGQNSVNQTPPTAPQGPQQIAPDNTSSTTPTAPTDTTQPAPGGVRTPQQIYDQLIRMQQQAAQQQHPASPQ